MLDSVLKSFSDSIQKLRFSQVSVACHSSDRLKVCAFEE